MQNLRVTMHGRFLGKRLAIQQDEKHVWLMQVEYVSMFSVSGLKPSLFSKKWSYDVRMFDTRQVKDHCHVLRLYRMCVTACSKRP